MKYDAIFIDIDNTLYSYREVNEAASSVVVDFLHKETGISRDILGGAIKSGRADVHRTLAGTASSHNRLLYFQKAAESLGFTYSLALKAHSLFWDMFIGAMMTRDGVPDFFEDRRIPKFFVTDMTAELQIRKIDKMGLWDKTAGMISSEEAGVEKPHPYIYMTALTKAGVSPDRACMIGDDWNKDVLGAVSLGIDAFWLANGHDVGKQESEKIRFFHDFHELGRLIYDK